MKSGNETYVNRSNDIEMVVDPSNNCDAEYLKATNSQE